MLAHVEPLAEIVRGSPRPIASSKQPLVITQFQFVKRTFTYFRQSFDIKIKMVLVYMLPSSIPEFHRCSPTTLYLWACISPRATFKRMNLVVRFRRGKMKQESANGICGGAWKPIKIFYGEVM